MADNITDIVNAAIAEAAAEAASANEETSIPVRVVQVASGESLKTKSASGIIA